MHGGRCLQTTGKKESRGDQDTEAALTSLLTPRVPMVRYISSGILQLCWLVSQASNSILGSVKAIGVLKRMMWSVAITLSLSAFRSSSEQPLPDVKRLETSPVLRHLKANPMN